MYNYIAPCIVYSKSGHLVYCVLYVLIIHNTNNTYSVLCNTASFYASRLSSRDATRNAQNEHNKAAAAQQQQLRRSSSSGAAAALAQQQLRRSSSSRRRHYSRDDERWAVEGDFFLKVGTWQALVHRFIGLERVGCHQSSRRQILYLPRFCFLLLIMI